MSWTYQSYLPRYDELKAGAPGYFNELWAGHQDSVAWLNMQGEAKLNMSVEPFEADLLRLGSNVLLWRQKEWENLFLTINRLFQPGNLASPRLRETRRSRCPRFHAIVWHCVGREHKRCFPKRFPTTPLRAHWKSRAKGNKQRRGWVSFERMAASARLV